TCLERWLRGRPAADNLGPRPAVVDVPTGVAFASAGQGIPVGLLRPRPFFEADAVVIHDRALAGVQVGDRLVVFDDSGPEGALSDGPAALGVENVVEGDAATAVQSFAGLDFALRRGPTVGVGLRELEIGFEVSQ